MQNYGAKRLVSGAKYGLMDWLAQRVTALILVLFLVVLLTRLLWQSTSFSYLVWASAFSPLWMKALAFVAFCALMYHAWVGVRDILMDYVKSTWLRLSLEVFALVWLLVCLAWVLLVLSKLS
ncbi:MAG: succinate dehydrogenase, hydrophobic membrane anchor protein [Gammaproteobacteria bacterium]|nr:succinate dehydrogenase, hydrophobic membrane anchor protein [Gammaproteobacteria bacterium]